MSLRARVPQAVEVAAPIVGTLSVTLDAVTVSATATMAQPASETPAARSDVWWPWSPSKRDRIEDVLEPPKKRKKKPEPEETEPETVQFDGKGLLGQALPKEIVGPFSLPEEVALDAPLIKGRAEAARRHRRRLMEDDDWLMLS